MPDLQHAHFKNILAYPPTAQLIGGYFRGSTSKDLRRHAPATPSVVDLPPLLPVSRNNLHSLSNTYEDIAPTVRRIHRSKMFELDEKITFFNAVNLLLENSFYLTSMKQFEVFNRIWSFGWEIGIIHFIRKSCQFMCFSLNFSQHIQFTYSERPFNVINSYLHELLNVITLHFKL